MNQNRVSEFTLERYRLGELPPEEMQAVEKLAAKSGLRSRIEELDESDRELRLLYPLNRMGLPLNRARKQKKMRPSFLAKIAAVLVLCILFPALYLMRSNAGTSAEISADVSAGATDRAKGSAAAGPELSVFLKGSRDVSLEDKAILREGNTVQLAYTAPAGIDRYGVIFSIDGRFEVTMHYPYREGQSSLLVPGKQTYLNEAYTLDDATDYEIFVMVVSEEALDAEAVLREARNIAKKQNSMDLLSLVEESRAAFTGCEVETVTVLKE